MLVAELILLGLLVYAWAVYPLLLSAVAGRRCAPTPVAPSPGCASILLSAHNEERAIGARLENLVAAMEELRCMGWEAEALVGADGCTDRTARVVREWVRRDSRIRLREVPERGGKIRMLKRLVSEARGSVLVLTDANTNFATGALRALFSHLGDPKVGGVCGRLVLERGTGDRSQGTGDRSQETGVRRQETGDRSQETEIRRRENELRPPDAGSRIPDPVAPSPERSYWDWEAKLKLLESRLDSCLGANGAIYAVRKELFWREVPDNTIIDDFVIGMKVREQGFRMVFEPSAMAFEELPDLRDEWRRRVRIGAGDFQAIGLCRRCLLPRFGWLAWAFWSHKVLRWFTPHLLLGLLLCAIAGMGCATPDPGSRPPCGCPLSPASAPLSRLIVAAFTLGFGLWGGARGLSILRIKPPGFLAAWDHFASMHAALLAGSLRFARGNLQGHWHRTPRGG